MWHPRRSLLNSSESASIQSAMAPRASVDVVTIQETAQPRLHGLLMTWDAPLVAKFINAANDCTIVADPTLDFPLWLSEPRGSLSPQGFIQDTMRYLAEISNGSQGTILSPLTMMQSLHLARRMGQIEMHPFMQACAKRLPDGSCLVSGVHFFQDPSTDGVSTNLPGPPAPHRQIFR